MQAEEIKDGIRAAFPATAFAGVSTECSCDECSDIQLQLRGKRWDEVSKTFIDITQSPALLEPEAFCAYIAAYMVRTLGLVSEPGNNVVEMTVYSLSPGDHEQRHDARKGGWLLKRARLMNANQIRVIRQFLEFTAENAVDAKWLGPFIARALNEVWK